MNLQQPFRQYAAHILAIISLSLSFSKAQAYNDTKRRLEQDKQRYQQLLNKDSLQKSHTSITKNLLHLFKKINGLQYRQTNKVEFIVYHKNLEHTFLLLLSELKKKPIHLSELRINIDKNHIVITIKKENS